MDYVESVLDLIGHTPLVRLKKVTPPDRLVLAKLEYFNPGGSVKDRIGYYMLKKAEEEGKLKPGSTVVEPTSGNTGVGLALVCAIKGYHLVCVMPDKVPIEKVRLLQAYGAECVLCPTDVPPEDPRSYYRQAERIARERSAFMPQQYENPNNPGAHYVTTGPEIWEQTNGKVTHVVMGVGTGGTISGTGKFLKEKNPHIKIIGVDTYGSVYTDYFRTGKVPTPHQYLIDGIGEDFIPQTVDFSVIDEIIPVTDKDAYQTTMKLAREEGIFTGSSGGAAVWVALNVARDAHPDDCIVVLLPDTGERYLSKLNDEWMRKHGLLDPS